MSPVPQVRERAYVVVMEDSTTETQLTSIRGTLSQYVKHEYTTIFNGFSLEAIPDDEMERVLNDVQVKQAYPVRLYDALAALATIRRAKRVLTLFS